MLKNSLLLGVWRHLVQVPGHIWQKQVHDKGHTSHASLSFMTEDHRRVQNYVVSELPRAGASLVPQTIALALGLTIERVVAVLDELEKGMTFLFRNPEGLVNWAYPVTVEPTPHRLTFSSGEKLYAAWAVDAIASPFVQGHLRKEPLSILIETECAHCGQPIHIEMDSALKYRVVETDAQPLIFVPTVDFKKLKDPSIIDAFWRRSVFFWSEEHAREYRRTQDGGPGTYMTLDQAVYITPIVQGGLFEFSDSEVK
jgi:hypothetical protein